ncbi:MAG: hypothetical protein KatS3mg002_0940 [Candidatus Woesearchaeota archaeon]|nr:MAG: hypothetical protein KatS3mg002_0940 [Candidatus Woesearchaeota archaeon]
MRKNKAGYGLEKYVELLYKDLGYKNVIRNVIFRMSKGDYADAQIDLTYDGPLGNVVYVECKYHSKGNVSFSEFAKFVQVLNILKIPKLPVIYRGELVTNTYFDKRTINSAEVERIKLIDKDGLIELEKKRNSLAGTIFAGLNSVEIYKNKGPKDVIKYLLNRALPIETQIKRYSA